MADSSHIQWTEATWNPVTGCSKVSQGCKHCYALRDWPRLAANPRSVYYGREFTDVRCHPERLEQPLRWRKPRRIFVNSMSDLFHEDVPDEFIADVFGVMGLASAHTFQILTKRPARMRQWVNDHTSTRGHLIQYIVAEPDEWRAVETSPMPPPNVWLGVSCEDQETANERIPLLLETPAAVRFVSAEPLLGPVRFREVLSDDWLASGKSGERRGLDWVIVGGESGPRARPFELAWARSIIEQCGNSRVPVFVKQLGGFPVPTVGVDYSPPSYPLTISFRHGTGRDCLRLRNSKGGNPDEWPEDLRVREYPA